MIAEIPCSRPDRWTAIWRGFRRRCPCCGQGRLFRSYLRLTDRCATCATALGELRADDGPAWATILVVGHIVVPCFVVAARGDAPAWVQFGVLLPAAIALTALLLPRFKGVFVALLWLLDLRSGAAN